MKGVALNLFSKRFSTRFCLTAEGVLETGEGGEQVPFKIEAAARGADDPARGNDITGVIDVRGVARGRPLIGAIEAGNKQRRICFSFTDDEFNQHRFEGVIRGRLYWGRSYLANGSLQRDDGNEPWARLRPAGTGPTAVAVSSRRIERRKKRPRYKDRMAAFMGRPNLPLPLRRTGAAFAEAALPPGKVLEGGGEHTVERIESSALAKSNAARWVLGAGLFGVSSLFRLTTGKRFSRATTEERMNWLTRSERPSSGVRRIIHRFGFKALTPLLVPLVSAFKFFHINTDDAHKRLGANKLFGVAPDLVGDITSPQQAAAPDPPQPWETQVLSSESFDSDEVVEADVVVVGTGAGGGPVAKELAERGFAVAIVEAGRYIKRQDSAFGSQNATLSLGNALILLPMGQAVGGTTFINAGTCFRTPPDVLMQWVDHGMPELHPDKMAPYFDRVEEIQQVAEADPKYVGPVGEVIRRGCDRLEYHSKNLRRNAPLCEGEALCSVGCPHGAKQSTDKSYIPLALKSKASLFTGFKVREILTSGGRAIGVHAYGKGSKGEAVRLTVFARAVVLAAGALLTPPLIQKNRLDRGNKWIGANLSFHPATRVIALTSFGGKA